MSAIQRRLGLVPPIIVVAAILGFVYYSLYLYVPANHVKCSPSFIGRQTDIAVQVVRQWFGKQGEAYVGCQESGS